MLEKIFLNTQGVQATLAADFDLSPDEIRGPITLSIPHATQTQVKSIWPDKLGTDTGAYHWIVERLSDGGRDRPHRNIQCGPRGL